MNKVQKTIAAVTGMRDEAIAVEDAYNQTQVALEQITNVRALVEIKLDELGYAGYFSASQANAVVLNSARDPQMIRRLRILRHENPLAKQAMKLALRFTLGRGIDYLVKDERAADIWKRFWTDPINKIGYTSHEALKGRLDEALTDGENYFICASTPGVAPYVRLAKIPMEEITSTVNDPGNANIPLFYKREFVPMVYDENVNNGVGGYREQFTGNKRIQVRYYQDYRVPDAYIDELRAQALLNIPQSKIDPQKMKHRFLNPLWTKSGYRGISELFASREWFRVYKEFMEARAAINEAANALTYVRKKKAGPAGVSQITGKFLGLDLAEEDATGVRRATRPIPGAMADILDDTDLTTIRADTGAADAVSDARGILQSAGAGVGTMLPYFGDGGDANLATAQTMELPMVKVYEDYQEFLQSDLTETYIYVLMVALDAEAYEDIPEEMTYISWDFPPIVANDVTKYITAWAQLTQQVAPGNLPLQLAAIKGALTTMNVPNVDELMVEITKAQEDLAAQKEAERQLRLDQQQMAIDNPVPPGGAPGDKAPPKGDGQKTGLGGGAQGLPPDAKRISDGKPPKQQATGPRSRRQ